MANIHIITRSKFTYDDLEFHTTITPIGFTTNLEVADNYIFSQPDFDHLNIIILSSKSEDDHQDSRIQKPKRNIFLNFHDFNQAEIDNIGRFNFTYNIESVKEVSILVPLSFGTYKEYYGSVELNRLEYNNEPIIGTYSNQYLLKLDSFNIGHTGFIKVKKDTIDIPYINISTEHQYPCNPFEVYFNVEQDVEDAFDYVKSIYMANEDSYFTRAIEFTIPITKAD